MPEKKSKKKYKRIGKCNGCGMCCLFKDGIQRIQLNSNTHKFYKRIGFVEVGRMKCKPKRGRTYTEVGMSKLVGCPYLIFDKGKIKCSLHGKKTKPKVCKDYPVNQHGYFYEVFKKWCGYKFIEVKK